MIKKFTFLEPACQPYRWFGRRLLERNNRQAPFHKFRVTRKNEHPSIPLSKGEQKAISRVIGSFFIFTLLQVPRLKILKGAMS